MAVGLVNIKKTVLEIFYSRRNSFQSNRNHFHIFGKELLLLYTLIYLYYNACLLDKF